MEKLSVEGDTSLTEAGLEDIVAVFDDDGKSKNSIYIGQF